MKRANDSRRNLDGDVGRKGPSAKSPSRADLAANRLIQFATLALLSLFWCVPSALAADAVTLTEKDVAIPTYLAGDPEPNPVFYFGRASQGAQGRVYPYPLYDTLTDIKSNKTYRIVYLENEYVRIGVLPEIGGRLFEAVDKSNGYDFIYRQHVIKPALIGIIGAWISGGIEWNIPHHHRATTFLPVQYRVEENVDGSKTVWVGELELRQRMRWAVGYTLHPGRSYLQCSVRILNRTPFVNSMLCFANVAVHVNDTYQVIYPPRTQLVTFHSKNDFTTWPIATTRYTGIDFTRGVDVSWYSNHIAATSMFAWNYEDDFFAGYDHGKQAGIVSVANHHIVPGKKFWTWGNGPRGRMWDKILTDNDGPYIELMVGGYSDNQPDYSWLQPFETKSFEMNWYPFRDIDGVKEANLDAAVNLEISNGSATVGFCTTAEHDGATVSLKAGNKVLLEETVTISPGKPYRKKVSLPAGTEEKTLRAALLVNGKELVGYTPVQLGPAKIPERYKPAPAPGEVKTAEELYLAGRRIEQFHAPGRDPEPYWEEALRRDPGDTRAHEALGIHRVKQARFAEAEEHLRKAIGRLTASFTTAQEGEPFYYLGLALNGEGKTNEAFDAFYKATWSEAWRGPAYFALAEIQSSRGNTAAALDCVERSLDGNGLNIRALTLKAALLRHSKRADEAKAVLQVAARKTDPLDVRLMSERWLSSSDAEAELAKTMRDFPATALETAVEYGNAGLWTDAEAVLKLHVKDGGGAKGISPLVYYYLAQCAENRGDLSSAAEDRKLAREASPEYVFPFQWEAIATLRRALAVDPNDARAAYYLGNVLYDWQPEEAIKLWEKAISNEPSLAIAQRNLAIAYSHRAGTNDSAKAIAALERAVALPHKYAMHFTELDELYAANGIAPQTRLELLERNHEVVSRRDDALSHEIGLKVFAGKYDEAIQLMADRKFRVWEGGSLEVADHWVNAHILRGQRKLAERKPAEARADFEAAKRIPENLPSDTRRGGNRDAEISYLLGNSFEALGDAKKAREHWQAAAEGRSGEASARESSPRRDRGGLTEGRAQVYFQALAKRKLGKEAEAEKDFRGLAGVAEDDHEGAVEAQPESGRRPRGFGANRVAVAHYLSGLGELGLGNKMEAKRHFALALKATPDFLGARNQLDMVK